MIPLKTSVTGFLPELTTKDIRILQKEFDKEVKLFDKEHADFQSLSVEDKECFLASLHFTFHLSKRIAKKKFTPKKYRYWEK